MQSGCRGLCARVRELQVRPEEACLVYERMMQHGARLDAVAGDSTHLRRLAILTQALEVVAQDYAGEQWPYRLAVVARGSWSRRRAH